MICDDEDIGDRDSKAETFYRGFVNYENHSYHVVALRSEQNCYFFTLNAFFKFLNEYWWLFGALLMIVGFFVGFFGKPLFKPTICIVGSLVFIVLSSIFFFSVIFNGEVQSETWMWVTFALCCLVGFIVGILLAKLSRVGVAVLAAWGGVCLGLICYNAFFHYMDGEKHIAFWIVIILFAIATGAISFKFFKPMLIVSTALIGSYSMIRGLSLYAGGFPPEMQIVQLIQAGQVSAAFYGYMAGFVVLLFLCGTFQFKKFYNSDSGPHHPYHYKH